MFKTIKTLVAAIALACLSLPASAATLNGLTVTGGTVTVTFTDSNNNGKLDLFEFESWTTSLGDPSRHPTLTYIGSSAFISPYAVAGGINQRNFEMDLGFDGPNERQRGMETGNYSWSIELDDPVSAAVPLPASAAFLLTGLAALRLSRRCRG